MSVSEDPTDTPAESAEHTEHHAQSPSTSAGGVRDTSAPAIAATVALVLFSVFIGVFGPRIGNRQQSPAGVTLVELAEAVVARSQPHFAESELGRTEELTEPDFEERLDRITRSGVAVPSLEELGMEGIAVQRVRLPGGSGALAVVRARRGGLDWGAGAMATITMLEDEDRFTVYDRFSRPIAMPVGEVFRVEDGSMPRSGTVEVFRQGDFVIAVHAQSAELAQRLVAAIQSEAARRMANLRRDGA